MKTIRVQRMTEKQDTKDDMKGPVEKLKNVVGTFQRMFMIVSLCSLNNNVVG